MVTKKFKHKDNNGTVTEYDIGALASNVLHSDGQTAEQKGAALNSHLQSASLHVPEGGEDGQVLSKKIVLDILTFGNLSYLSDEGQLVLTNYQDGDISSLTSANFLNKTLKLDGYADLLIDETKANSLQVTSTSATLTIWGWVDSSGAPVYGASGTNVNFIGEVISDSTEWKPVDSSPTKVVEMEIFDDVTLVDNTVYYADRWSTEPIRLPIVPNDGLLHEIRVFLDTEDGGTNFIAQQGITWQDGAAPVFQTCEKYEIVFTKFGWHTNWCAKVTKYFAG